MAIDPKDAERRRREAMEDPSNEAARREMAARAALREAEAAPRRRPSEEEQKRIEAMRQQKSTGIRRREMEMEERMEPSPPATHAKGVRGRKGEVPEKSFKEERRGLMENLKRADHERSVLERRFDELPAIQHLRELWQERSLLPNDPVFLLVEVLGLYEERQKKTLRQFMEVLRASDRFTVDGLMEMEQRIKDIEKMERSAAKVRPAMEGCDERMQGLMGVLPDLAEHFEAIRDKLSETCEMLDQRGWKQVAINVLTPVVSFLTGAVFMFIWSR
jgi:hypothetical protein